MPIPSLEDAKRQLRQGDEQLDPDREAEIEGFIADAAAWVERYTGHILVARDVTERFDGFGDLTLRAWPVAADAAPAVAYGDPGAVMTTIVGARLAAARRPARVLAPVSLAWPRLTLAPIVTVVVRAGYEDDEFPGSFRRAMLILISAFDDDREGGEVLALAERTAKRLCGDYRLRRL